MTGAKRLEETSRQKDNLSTLESMALGLAHELKNPLGGIRGSAQLLRDELKKHLENNGVETKIMHEPLVCDAPIYDGCNRELPNARKVLEKSLIIPSHEKLSTDQTQHVIDLMNQFHQR